MSVGRARPATRPARCRRWSRPAAVAGGERAQRPLRSEPRRVGQQVAQRRAGQQVPRRPGRRASPPPPRPRPGSPARPAAWSPRPARSGLDGPCAASTPAGPTTAAAAVSTGQSSQRGQGVVTAPAGRARRRSARGARATMPGGQVVPTRTTAGRPTRRCAPVRAPAGATARNWTSKCRVATPSEQVIGWTSRPSGTGSSDSEPMPLSSRASRAAASSSVWSPGSQCPPSCSHSPPAGAASAAPARDGSMTSALAVRWPGRAGAPHRVRAARRASRGSPAARAASRDVARRQRGDRPPRRRRAAAAARGRPADVLAPDASASAVPSRNRSSSAPRISSRLPARRRAACRRGPGRARPPPGCRRACP